MEQNEQNSFRFTYSAKEQAEIKRLREKYDTSAQPEDKMNRLRRLDQQVTAKAQTVALTVGILGVLILGSGMSLVMSNLGEIMGISHHIALPAGCIIGVVGGILTGIAYPLYNLVLKRERQKIAPEIIRLTDELMK